MKDISIINHLFIRARSISIISCCITSGNNTISIKLNPCLVHVCERICLRSHRGYEDTLSQHVIRFPSIGIQSEVFCFLIPMQFD